MLVVLLWETPFLSWLFICISSTPRAVLKHLYSLSSGSVSSANNPSVYHKPKRFELLTAVDGVSTQGWTFNSKETQPNYKKKAFILKNLKTDCDREKLCETKTHIKSLQLPHAYTRQKWYDWSRQMSKWRKISEGNVNIFTTLHQKDIK